LKKSTKSLPTAKTTNSQIGTGRMNITRMMRVG